MSNKSKQAIKKVQPHHPRLLDDDRSSLRLLIATRTPSLVFGVLLGFMLSLTTSQFEEVLQAHVEIVFFIPFIVYLADAVGTQTQSIFTRAVADGRVNLMKYVYKESLTGLVFGSVIGLVAGLISGLWFGGLELALAVGFSTFGAVAVAPLVSVLTCYVLQLQHTDPAVGAGPIATVIQDSLSVMIFGSIATWILL